MFKITLVNPQTIHGTHINIIQCRRAKLGQIQGGGVAEGLPRFDKGGVAIIIYLLHVKNRTFLEFLR